MLEKANFFVLTGGPGVGKTTLLHALRSQGELCVEESARAVIRDELATGGRAVPWIDPEAFAAATAARDVARFDSLAGETRRVFFDRGIMDSWRANGVPPSPTLAAALRPPLQPPRLRRPALARDLRARRRAPAGLGGGRGDLRADPEQPGRARLRTGGAAEGQRRGAGGVRDGGR